MEISDDIIDQGVDSLKKILQKTWYAGFNAGQAEARARIVMAFNGAPMEAPAAPVNKTARGSAGSIVESGLKALGTTTIAALVNWTNDQGTPLSRASVVSHLKSMESTGKVTKDDKSWSLA